MQIDLLENTAFDNVVVLSVVLDEVKNKNLAVYNRIRALCNNSLRNFYVFANKFHKSVPISSLFEFNFIIIVHVKLESFKCIYCLGIHMLRRWRKSLQMISMTEVRLLLYL